MDEEDAIEASDDDGFGAAPAPLPAAAFKRPAPTSARQQSVRAFRFLHVSNLCSTSFRPAAAFKRPALLSARQQSVGSAMIEH